MMIVCDTEKTHSSNDPATLQHFKEYLCMRTLPVVDDCPITLAAPLTHEMGDVPVCDIIMHLALCLK